MIYTVKLRATAGRRTLILGYHFERGVGSLVGGSHAQLAADAVRLTRITYLHRSLVVAVRTHQDDDATPAARRQQQLNQQQSSHK